jgi:hypothetical protein
MARICTICTHPKRAAIEIALGTAEPIDQVAKRFDVSTGSVTRHRTNHLAPMLEGSGVPLPGPGRRKVIEATMGSYAGAVVESIRTVARDRLDRSLSHEDQLDALWDQAVEQLTEAGKLRQLVDPETKEVRFDMLAQLLAISKARIEARGGGSLKWATLAAEIEGDLTRGNQVNITMIPDVKRLLDAIESRFRTKMPEAVPLLVDLMKELAVT